MTAPKASAKPVPCSEVRNLKPHPQILSKFPALMQSPPTGSLQAQAGLGQGLPAPISAISSHPRGQAALDASLKLQ